MDDSDLELILYIIVALAIGAILVGIINIINGSDSSEEKEEEKEKKKKVTSRPDLIQDEKVTVTMVEEKLKGFKLQTIPNRKSGFTEKDVHKQLERYLKDIFQNVTMEQGIESKNAKAIDLDIANGKVGIEVKLASEVLKEGGWDRAIGQMVKYTRLKYKNENLIFFIAGFDEDLRNSMLSDIEDDAHANKCNFHFASAGLKSQILETA